MSIKHIQKNFELSDEAREIILKKMNLSGLPLPVVGLMIAKWDDETNFNLKIGFFEKDKIQDGWLVSSSINPSELVFYTYQPEIIEKLEAGLVTIIEGQIEIVPLPSSSTD